MAVPRRTLFLHVSCLDARVAKTNSFCSDYADARCAYSSNISAHSDDADAADDDDDDVDDDDDDVL